MKVVHCLSNTVSLILPKPHPVRPRVKAHQAFTLALLRGKEVHASAKFGVHASACCRLKAGHRTTHLGGMRSARICIAIGVWFAVLPFCLQADQVSLSNGDRVTGKVVKKDGDKLIVKTDLMGEVTIPWKSVASVSSQEPLTVVLPDGKTVVGKIGTDESEKKLEVATAAATEAVPLGDLVAIRDDETQRQYERLQDPGLLDLWTGFIDLGVSAARGNARTNLFTTAAIATRETRTDKTVAYFNQIYARGLVEDVFAPTAEAIRGGWSYDRNITSRLFATLFNDYEYDRFQDLDLRFVVGGGLGYIVIKDERKRLDLLAGLAYNREKFSTPLIRNSAEAYWGDEFNYKLSEVVLLQQRFRMFHNLSDTGPYRMNFDLSVVTNLNKWLAWQLTVSDRFLSNPVPGRQRNDILYTSGLRLTFAR
jgi:putative salt-induced outer membrane protein YdiY